MKSVFNEPIKRRKRDGFLLRRLSGKGPFRHDHNTAGGDGESFSILFGIVADLGVRWYDVLFIDDCLHDITSLQQRAAICQAGSASPQSRNAMFRVFIEI